MFCLVERVSEEDVDLSSFMYSVNQSSYHDPGMLIDVTECQQCLSGR